MSVRRQKAIECTLTNGERFTQAVSWRNVARRYVTRLSERSNGYILALNSEDASSIEINALVESERRCCAWMDLTLDPGPPATLTITTDSPGGKDVIAEMLGLRC